MMAHRIVCGLSSSPLSLKAASAWSLQMGWSFSESNLCNFRCATIIGANLSKALNSGRKPQGFRGCERREVQIEVCSAKTDQIQFFCDS